MSPEDYLQFDHHIQCVLKSGLLLDEDIETLSPQYTYNYENLEVNNKSYIQIGLSLASAATTFFFVRKDYSPLLSATCASLAAVITTLQIKKCLINRTRKRRIEEIIQNLRNILKLNRMVLNYLKQRKSLGGDQFMDPYTSKIEELMTILLNNEISLLLALLGAIKLCCLKVPTLCNQYSHLDLINLKQFDINNIGTIDDCISYQKMFSDIFLLVVSNSLTCLSLTFCPSLWNKVVDFNEIICDIVPKIQLISRNCYVEITKKFNETKFNLVRNREVKIETKNFDNFVTSKLHNSLLNSMMHTSIVLEKSQIIFEKLQKVDLSDTGPRKEVAKQILELRDHALDYYESLDILCKLYEITVNNPRKVDEDSNQVEVKTDDIGEVRELSPLNLNEPLEDEEYEMYIGEKDFLGGSCCFNYQDEEESARFASLMTEELKHSLKTHSRFLAAREKRGIVDEPHPREIWPSGVIGAPLGDRSNRRPGSPLPPPPLLMEESVNDNKLQGFTLPPPPPPLPVLDNLNQRENMGESRGFLHSIRNLSTTRNIVEDIFGSD